MKIGLKHEMGELPTEKTPKDRLDSSIQSPHEETSRPLSTSRCKVLYCGEGWQLY